MSALRRLDAFHVRIPMQYKFGHARAARAQADNVFVRVTLSDGREGWGEAVPREYVTGETIESVMDALDACALPELPIEPGASFGEAARSLWRYDLARNMSDGERLAQAAACALETALLDAHGRRDGRPILDVLDEVEALHSIRRPTPLSHVRQTLTFGEDIEGALERAGELAPDLEVKVKVGYGPAKDAARLARVRAAVGDAADLRVDANGVWSPEEALRSLGALAAFGLSSVEEPLARGALEACATLREQSGVPIMLDESLCTLADAERAHQLAAAELLNLRLSKCGGVLGTLRIVAYAQQVGLGYQLGCMVGETGLLASLGRSFVARVAGVRHFESTVPRLSLVKDVTDAVLDLAPRTRETAPPAGPGFGASLDPAVIEQFTVRRASWPA